MFFLPCPHIRNRVPPICVKQPLAALCNLREERIASQGYHLLLRDMDNTCSQGLCCRLIGYMYIHVFSCPGTHANCVLQTDGCSPLLQAPAPSRAMMETNCRIIPSQERAAPDLMGEDNKPYLDTCRLPTDQGTKEQNQQSRVHVGIISHPFHPSLVERLSRNSSALACYLVIVRHDEGAHRLRASRYHLVSCGSRHCSS